MTAPCWYEDEFRSATFLRETHPNLEPRGHSEGALQALVSQRSVHVLYTERCRYNITARVLQKSFPAVFTRQPPYALCLHYPSAEVQARGDTATNRKIFLETKTGGGLDGAERQPHTTRCLEMRSEMTERLVKKGKPGHGSAACI